MQLAVIRAVSLSALAQSLAGVSRIHPAFRRSFCQASVARPFCIQVVRPISLRQPAENVDFKHGIIRKSLIFTLAS